MSARKTERLMNLVICLLAARGYVSKERIRRTVAGYEHCKTDEAFERMFDRDKEELREMGIPLEVGTHSAWFEDEPGYRIRPNAYALPDLDLEPDEAAVLSLAARFWQHASLARAASDALLKLKAAGVETGEVSLTGIEPRVTAGEPAFEPLWQAVRDRYPVTFPYRRATATEPQERHVEPWGIVCWHGRWYLGGYDRDRQAPRVFRLDRVAGEVRPIGAPGSVRVPEEVNIRAMVVESGDERARGQARLRLRAGAGFPLRRSAASVTPESEEWDIVEVWYRDPEDFAQWLATFGADVVVLDPPEIRETVIRRLKAVAGMS